MANVYYTCNLLPPWLAAARGHTLRWLGSNLTDPSAPARRDALTVHPMTCPFVTRLVAAAESVLATADDRLIVPAGCDAMRRLGDLMSASYPGRVFVLAMPRSSTSAAQATLAQDLTTLDNWLDGLESAARPEKPMADGPALSYPDQVRPGGVFVVAGPLSDDALPRLLSDLGAGISGLESCTSPDRVQALGDLSAPYAGGEDGTAPGPERYSRMAAAMLDAAVCPRRSTRERRAFLAGRLDQAAPSAVIYARQSFCDPGAYDALEVASLAHDRGLPFLEIEVGFPFESSGPLRTRVEAFLEAQMLDDDLLSDLDDEDLFDDVDSGDLLGDLDDEDLFDDEMVADDLPPQARS